MSSPMAWRVFCDDANPDAIPISGIQSQRSQGFRQETAQKVFDRRLIASGGDQYAYPQVLEVG